MGNLSKEDYRKIKNIIETFIDTPVIVDNLSKSLLLFLETKKEEAITIVKDKPITPVSKINSLRVKNEIENANTAMDKYTDRLRKMNVKRRRKASSKVVS